jgi:cyclic pyranopterin phosphate synthase
VDAHVPQRTSLGGVVAGRVIAIRDTRERHRAVAVPADPDDAAGGLVDRLQRPLLDLRISVTDRCNFRCVYCMPREVFDGNYPYVSHSELLSFEEITRLARIFVLRGTRKIRLTGGEPLLRRDLDSLVRMLAQLRSELGVPLDLAITTNGSLLKRHAAALAHAGLQRVTVSLDALDDAIFRRASDVDFPVSQVLEGIDAAAAAGFAPLKVNMVVKRGLNEDQVLPMARYFRERGHVLRFIEYMDVGNSNGWRLDDVVPTDRLLERIDAQMPLEPVAPSETGAVAQRWRYRDGSGEIGTISSISRAFCGDCTRARLSTEGALYLCLFGQQGHDLRALLRAGSTDTQIAAAIGAVWRARADRYSEQRSANTSLPAPRIEMSYIGG